MSSNHTQNVPSPSPSTLFLPLGRRSRRGSLSSLSSQVDKEQLSLALDQIHNSASQSETLTTFNDFASPPSASAGADGKRLAGDLVQSGLSGLYNRFRDAVDGVKDKVGGVVAVNDQRGYDDPAKSPSSLLSHTKSISRGSIDSLTVVSPSGAASTPLSRLPSPLTTNFGPEISGVDARLKNALRPNSTVASSQASITSAGGSGLKSPLPPLTKPLSTIDPTVAPVNVSAFQDTDNRNTYAWEEPERGLPSDTSTRSLSLSETKSKTGRADSDRRNQRTISGGRLVPDQVDGPANRVSSSKDWNILSPAEIRQSDDPLEDGLDIESIPSDDQVSNVLQNPQTTSIQHTIGLHEKSVSSADIRASRHTANGSTHSIKSFDGSATFEHRRSLSKSDGSQQVRNTSAKLDIVRPERHFRDSDTILTEESKGRSRESSITLDGVKDINIATDNSRTSKNAQVNSGSASHPKNFSSEVKNKVLSREFWMRDENAKDCFYCGDTFSTWRRKHHCRTCGQIFDSKCTSLISGKRFGQSGNIRVCKPCEAIIQADEDDSSEFSDDEVVLPPSFFTKGQGDVDSERADQNIVHDSGEGSKGAKGEDIGSRGLNTPMMAIPATRRPGDPSSRRSAILEFTGDQPNLRPSSSRSIMPPATARPHSHRAYHPRHQLSRSVRSFHEDRAPFHRSSKEDLGRFSRLPAFHNDSIIDPELAPFMSDEGSSEDEQMSIFTTMAGDNQGRDADSERDYSSGQPPSSRKSRSRTLEKIAGFGHREGDEANIVSFRNLPRTSRNRTHSAASTTHQRPSPRTYKSTAFSRGHAATFAETGGRPPSVHGLAGIALGGTRLMRSASMRGDTAPPVELNDASLEHVRKLLRQLLQDFEVPSSKSWENALVPMLLRCSDDVNPDVRSGDDIDIRHYVKLKKIPGGRPCDTSYVSGIVFSKNLALKSMPRNIPHPGILLVTFPVEYHRHQQHFMSLEPIIAQEREFVRKMVNRIVALNPQLLLAQKNVSGLALQYLDEANIATAYNVKPSVIAAVSRFCETDIVSSIDRLATSPRIGESDAFEVRTFKHEEIPGRRKSYFYISGCPRELGCTIVLRGADLQTLSKVKRITEFLVYVVYNLKLETALMRDESVFVPSTETPMPPPGPKSVSEVSPAISAGESVASDQTGGDSEETAEATAQSPGLTYSDTQSPGSDNKSANKDFEIDNHDDLPLPANIPMPTFYEDMVHKYETKVLSASPLVRFPQPYLLMRAREQERRLAYLRLLRDQDDSEDQSADDSSRQEEFHLIQPEMIHEKVEGAPKKVREVLRAVHDAEYDRALHNYETQKRQWEAFISANDDLFDPLVHQNIVVLFSVVCTITTVPCSGPDMLALSFYNEHETEPSFEADCTLGQYVEELCLSANSVCTANGCERRMIDHHRQYVHGEACLSIFVEKHKPKLRDMPDVIAMWSYCKICKQETAAKPMSEDTWKYSFAKYLEMSFWNAELHKKGGLCPHDATRDHLRYFSFKDVAVRIHYDRINLLEIIVPRSRITWKVDRDLRLKNEEYVRIEERLNRFMTSVKGRIKGMNTESVVPEKAEACKEEIEKLIQRSNDEHDFLLKKLQEKYMNSKYFEIIPLNRAVRALQEKVAEWDSAFADFDEKFFPSEKDIRRLTALQLKKIFLDREDSVSSITDEGTESPSVISENDITGGDSEKPALSFSPRPTNLSPEKAHDMLASVVDEHSQSSDQSAKEQLIGPGDVDPSTSETLPMQRQARNVSHEDVQHLDLAMPSRFPENNVDEQNMPSPGSASVSPKTTKSGLSPEEPTVSSSDEPDNSKIESGGPPRKSVSSTINTEDTAKASGIPRLQDGRFRRMGSSSSPPLQRAHSQPAHAQRVASDQRNTGDVSMEAENPKIARVESSKPPELRLSERLGLSGTKSGKKNLTPSLIPRSVPGNRIGSKVSTLAKHFEELSREFELERLRERRRHAARMKQARAYPMVSSKPIVEVYRDVDAAVEEKEPSDEEARPIATATPMADTTDTTDSATLDKLTAEAQGSHIDRSQEECKAISDEATVTGGEAQTSDIDEGTDAEESLLDDLQGSTDNSQILSPAEGQMEMKLDLPKHEKSSLMKMLTNFWAERSASGWTSLDYPLNATDHVFIDSDVVVREDEPSSLIAFALSSQDYLGKLNSIRKQGQMQSQDNVESGNGISNEADLERSLLRATGTHLKYQFQEGSAKMLCKIFYAEQFDAMRRKCGIADRFVETLSRCLKWDSKGGKTRSVFLKTLDDRFVLKSLSTIETQAFLRFAPAYFQIMSQALFHELPSVIAKMVGFYQIIIRNPATGTDIKWDVVVMENLFYDRNPTRIFDLKGSMRNRKIQSTGEQNEVLLDENMVDFIYESPLFAREHSKKLLRASVWNDTLFLARQNVMDYSLMIAIDENRKELVVGIIDCIRTYTWDKKLESWIKDRGFAGGGRNRPTVTSPKEYKNRFREAMARYVLEAPSCWHQFEPQQMEKRPLRIDERAENREGDRTETEVEVPAHISSDPSENPEPLKRGSENI